MDTVDNIFEPIELYKNRFKEEHAKNVKDFFEDLVKNAGIDEEKNAITVKEIKKKEIEIPLVNKKFKKNKALKALSIISTVLCFLCGPLMIYGYFQTNPINQEVVGQEIITLIMGVFVIFVGIGNILLITKKLNKIIKDLDKNLQELKNKLQEYKNEAFSQMRPLNNLYDWSMAANLVQKTTPLIKLDPYFDGKRFDYLNRKYGLSEDLGKNTSILFTQSGDIINNPFLIAKTLNHVMGTKTYHGSITISWTVTKVVNGKTVTETRRQTLTASLTKPYPEYYTDSFIIYGNEAAPDLSFSRSPSKIDGLNEKQIQKKVSKDGKRIEKMARKAIDKGSSFTAMTNQEFDVLFNATDRDNEIQFRLLFTPLAQKQIINIIKDNTYGYGDDWYFKKRKQLNYITPKHLHKIDISANPSIFINYDIQEARRIFNEYNNEYFRSLYFAMAPLLAIPLYQQHQPFEFIYKDVLDSNISTWEHESMVNYLDEKEFQHPKSNTRNILKTALINKGKDYDEIAVTAYGYMGISRIDYVNVLGGDGNIHPVPVHWIEYIPLERTSSVVIKVADKINRPQFISERYSQSTWQSFIANNAVSEENFIFRKSLLAYIAKRNYSSEVDETFNSLIDNHNK